MIFTQANSEFITAPSNASREPLSRLEFALGVVMRGKLREGWQGIHEAARLKLCGVINLPPPNSHLPVVIRMCNVTRRRFFALHPSCRCYRRTRKFF